MLNPERAEIATFVEALFPYADENSFISLRAFDQTDRGQPARLIQGVQVGNGLVDHAVQAAHRAANSEHPWVFAPPVATFRGPRTAATSDLANGVAISVELDSGDTASARAKLEFILGPCTIAVTSGGEWLERATGQMHPKMHLHWRLSEPTRTPEDHERLRQARYAAALLVDGDTTAAPPVHPLRWPGSWNRKAAPKLARICASNPTAEVHLTEALAALQDAVEQVGRQWDDAPRASGTPQADMRRVAAATAHIGNPDVHWDQWTKIGMALYRASGGAQSGLDAWNIWSSQSAKHTPGACEERWAHFGVSPPTSIGAGTLFHMARAEGWQPPRREQPEDSPGYWASVEADADAAQMSEAEWHSLQRREAGEPIPASPEAKKAAGENLLWSIVEPWDEAAIPPRPWIVHGYLLRGSVTVLSGAGSAGKSSLMIAWAAALVIGCSYGRFKNHIQRRVATYNVEDDAAEQQRRFSGMWKRLGVAGEAWAGQLAILGPHQVGTLLSSARDGSLLVNTPVLDVLEDFLASFRPDVLMLDPFVELHAAEENSNTAIRAVMARFRTMAKTYDCALVVLHHAHKGLVTPGDPDSLRGASAIVGAARVALTLNVMSEEEAAALGLPKDARRYYSRLDGAKSNYAPIGEAEWFERVSYHLANGDEVPVAIPWVAPSLAPAVDVIAAALKGIADGSPHGPWSPRLSDDPRSFRILAERLGIEDHARQKALLDCLKNQHGVTVAECRKSSRKAKTDTMNGLRTADGAPFSAEWE